MKRNVSVVRFKFRCNILISGKIIKKMPGSVASGTHCITEMECVYCAVRDQSSDVIRLISLSNGRAVAQAVSRRPSLRQLAFVPMSIHVRPMVHTVIL